MLEGLVAWVLNNYLGKYVENLNTDQLSVALPSGKVELENLPLKKDAFRHLGLPVEVRAGFIGKVQLQVPVRQIRSAPWLIAIENIYIVAAPVNLDEWDAEAEAVIAHERKVALLDALEAQWRAELEATDASYYATSYSSWLSYGTGLLANIVENLQLKLNDVHIRYEDALTLGGRAFACGLTVQSLAAESCDAAWARGFAQLGADGCSFKLLELQQLAVYWDPVAVPGGLMSDCTSAELTARMSATWRSAHSYLVAPASAVARVCRERTEQPLRSRTRPRIKCNLTLDKVLLNLTSRQYSQAVGCARGLERIARLRAHRALRPAGAVAGGARAWWVYAVKCHTTRHEWLEPSPTWASCLQAAREARQYVDICLGVLNNPAATLPTDKKAIKDEYEWKTPLHVLKPLREIAMRKVPKSTPVSTPDKPASSGRSMLVHWFPQWWGWYSAPPAPEAAPPDLEEEILDVLADSLENNTLLKRDTVFGQFEFMLVNGSLNLIMVNTDEEEANPDKSSLPQLELDFSHVSLGLECRPRTGGLGATAGVGAVCVRDRLQPTAYPVLVHTGQVREGLSAMNTAASVMSWSRAPAPPAPAAPPAEPLFLLQYEKKPFNMNCDYKLYVKCQSLEVVYNRRVVRWASQFVLGPLGRPPLSAAAVRTRQHLLTHWQHIMRAHPGERRSWSVELDISAPQIFVVEELTSRDAPVLVVDFGRMRLNNAGPAPPEPTTPPSDDHDEECFMTPCSTPPGSLLSPASPPPGAAPPPSAHAIDAANLHQRLYDRYNIEFSDLQILVGRARDNWKYAHTKTSSSLHLLDRFSISLQAERRVVWTQDPQFPAATLRGTLPALVVHLSEPKLAAVAALLPAQPDTPSPRQTAHSAPAAAEDETEDSERSEQQHNAARLFMLQFAIDQMSLEVQSRGRSIAEVQVCGVKLALTARPVDVSTSLSVHSLLLVDALQTYGPDFELLVASHKHVGMDVASGSIRGSEPTSPVAPTSPTAPTSPPPPHALTHALNDLHAQMYKKQGEWERAKSPTAAWGAPVGPWGAVQGWGPAGTGWGPGASTLGAGGGWAGAGWGAAGMVDEEALIAIELCFVKGGEGSEDLRIANILFNNLDIIANQETIVELIGFTQRVLGTSTAKKPPTEPEHPAEPRAAPPAETSEETTEEVVKEVRTEITFDFHRLGVLLLRAQAEAGQLAAKKIATATLSEAKIQATLESTGMEVSGSLGGVGVVSLCGGVHARVCSAGRAAAPPPALYRAPGGAALTFGLTRKYCDTDVSVSLSLQVASVWYTHSARVLRELRSCVSEFQQYLADLGRSIRAAAADMAQGLVQPRMEGLYANPKLSQSMEGVSPRRRTISLATSVDDPTDKTDILLSITIELETPVVILPRSERSTQVLIAHLGRMSLANRQEGAAGGPGGAGGAGGSDYTVKVRDISLHSLDIAEKLKTHSLTAENMPLVYDAAAGRPVLHDTALHLTVNYNDEPGCEVTGKIVGGLRVTSTREQYVQLVDTLRWMGSDPAAPPQQPPPAPQHMQSSVAEGAVPTLRLDPAVRAQVLVPPPPRAPGRTRHTQLRVNFQLPHFTVELRADFGRGEKSMVDLSFREFNVNYERLHPHETNIQMSLHSITMEDLTQDPESKHRMLMVSHTPQVPKAVFVSKSCPDFVTEYPIDDLCSMSSLQQMRWNSNSLPSELNVTDREGGKKRDSKCGATPPCSPEAGGEARGSLQGEDNLVWISVHIRDPQHPLFEEKFDKVSKLTKVEFNCLKLVVSVDSWVAVIDFFGDEAADEPDEDTAQNAAPEPATVAPAAAGCSTTEMSIRSLSVLLVGCRGEGDICRGQVSRLRLESRADLGARTRSLEGRLGALALADLTPAAPAWRDRLLTHGDHALSFSYRRLSPSEAASSGHDTSLHITTGPVTYAHSRRFVAQIATAASDFSRLRSLIQQARQKVSVAVELSSATRLSLHVSCASPVIAVPVSGRVRAALVAELSALTLDNCFLLAGEPGAAAPRTDPACPHREVLDVRRMRLSGLSLWAGGGGRGLRLRRRGAPLLPAPAELLLQIELNCSATHNVPDMTIQGTLSTLQITLDPDQYRLIRGVLAHNLGDAGGEGGAPGAGAGGEPMTTAEPPPATDTGQVWTTTCIKLDLHGVALALQPARGAALATVNFIQSRLLIETDSRLHQDIDLVSQEILVSDTRFASEPANRRGNVFTRIVQPQPERRHRVQAELHARKRGTSSAYTILINNMRLMAIFDWWEAAHHFLMLPPLDPHSPGESPLPCVAAGGGGWAAPAPAPGTVELKLNITDSQVVFVEDASVWDTNAVILKSTTVITYRGAQSARPVSCVLNELEVFSCVLGLEEETALAIVEPCALHMDVLDHHTLRLSTRSLNLRLSYHDMRMFAAMLRSVPEQARLALSGKTESPTQEPDVPANRLRMRAPATRLGALSLRVSAPPAPPAAPPAPSMSPLHAVEVQADCITLCVIDDCCDSDVPLLEVSLSELHVQQDLRKVEEAFSDPILVSTPAGAPPPGPLALRPGPAGGKLTATLSADYYNRVLSGWEPFIEPWKFSLWWEYTLSSRLSLARLQAEVHSDSTLDVNVTHALLDLRAATSAAWSSQSQNSAAEASPKGSPMGHRRRSPFVPYALRNHTGHKLWFTTIVTTCDVLTEQSTYSGPDDSWVCVKAGETEPFSFGARARGRGLGSGGGAPARLHQLAIRLEGWSPPAPVCVDRAGVFWRSMTHTKTEAEARMVLEVSLEGSARKLVTARSALRLLNRLPHAVELRRDHAAAAVAWLRGPAPPHRRRAPPLSALHLHPLPAFTHCGQWSGSTPRTATVAPGASWSAPLSPGAPPLWVRPLARAPYSQCVRPLDWRQATAGRPYHGHYQCTAPDRSQYRFSCVVVRERFPPDRGPPCAGHTLTLLPELRLENLLPLELQYRARAADDEPPAAAGALPPGHTQPFHEVNVEEGVELSVKLEGFAWSSPLSVGGAGGAGGAGGSFTARLKLRDAKGRRLYLSARVSVKKTDGIKVCISAPYWLVNRVGLPLVYRAAGGGEAAGQQPEHEVARARAPLLFSIADDAPPTLAVRVGKCDSGTPEWCSPFGLGPGVVVKRLEVRGGGGGDRVYCVGVSVRAGRGRYRHTNIVTLTPRYQLHNNTKMVLQLAQKCTATDLNDPGAISTHVTAPPGSYLPWHWPRWERPQLLCVRVAGAGAGAGAGARTAWSGATAVTPRSVHLACREPGGGYVFLRVEVVAQGASLFIVLGDSAPLPPPLRLDNHSPLALMFHQVGCGEESVVGAHASLPWALPEPEGGRAVSLRAPGGPRLTLQLDALDTRHSLAYHNFIYVAFARSESGKNPNATSPSAKQNATTVEDVLVLEVPIGSTTVILGKKRYGDRSQLWRRGPNDSLIHEGSSPPQPTDAAGDHAAAAAAMHAMVLDIEGPAPRPGCPAPLALRRPSPRRASTQAWRLLRGRMTCAHDTLAVTAANTPGARAVLALAASDRSGQPPAEQAVQWQTLRPGSGHLDVRVYADGPTTVLKIVDSKEPESGWLEGSPAPSLPARREWGARVSLAGVAVSLLASAPPAELVRAELAGVRVDLAVADHVRVALAVEDVQLDNQLLGTPSPVLLYCLNPPPAPGAAGGAGGAALHAAADLALAPPGKYNALFFDHLVVSLAPIAIRLEERLILKLCVWAAWGDDAAATEHVDETDYETQRALQQLCAVHAPRCYIAALRLMPSQVRLSMCTANKLEGELAAVKRRLGLTLIKFEDAAVELEPFQRRHAFETPQYLADMILKHFKDELKWQAAKILGSVDFLGNPLGFVADVSEGVSGLIYEGSVGALLKNVTHGISNSAAKVTESLGDGLERVIVDEAHEETRRRIRSAGAGSHLAAGLRGLGLGLLGGMTSLVKHSYEGAAAEGLPGFLAGVGKGLVGTVTKPVIGVLDLAAETASALRDTSRRSDKWVPARRREPRCAAGAGGLLPRYCAAQAAGAHLLYQLNNGDYTEVFLAYRLVRATPHDIRALLSTLFLRIFTCKQRQPHLVMETHLSNLVSCAAVTSEGAHFVELGVRGGGAGGGGEALRRPRVQCDSAELAAWVARHAAYARQLYHETVHTLHPHTDV